MYELIAAAYTGIDRSDYGCCELVDYLQWYPPDMLRVHHNETRQTTHYKQICTVNNSTTSIYDPLSDAPDRTPFLRSLVSHSVRISEQIRIQVVSILSSAS